MPLKSCKKYFQSTVRESQKSGPDKETLKSPDDVGWKGADRGENEGGRGGVKRGAGRRVCNLRIQHV